VVKGCACAAVTSAPTVKVDPARDGRLDRGAAKADLGRLERGLLRGDVRLGLVGRGDRILIILARDRVDLDQIAVTLRERAGRGDIGLRARQRGAGIGGGGRIRRGIDLIEDLARMDGLALLEQALGDDSVHLRAHLGAFERRGAAGQLGRQRHRLHLDRDHADMRGRRRWRRLLAACRQQKSRDEGGGGNRAHRYPRGLPGFLYRPFQ
jgi:hypothetical protein